MKVIRVANSMGGIPRRASYQALVRRIKLWLHQSSHPVCTDDKPSVDAFGFYLLCELYQESLKSARLYRGEDATKNRIKELEEKFAIYQDSSESQNYFHNVKCFFVALEVIQSALFAVAHVGFSRGWSLRDRIKSLNLPKNLFPQSLRPVESLAH